MQVLIAPANIHPPPIEIFINWSSSSDRKKEIQVSTAAAAVWRAVGKGNETVAKAVARAYATPATMIVEPTVQTTINGFGHCPVSASFPQFMMELDEDRERMSSTSR